MTFSDLAKASLEALDKTLLRLASFIALLFAFTIFGKNSYSIGEAHVPLTFVATVSLALYIGVGIYTIRLLQTIRGVVLGDAPENEEARHVVRLYPSFANPGAEVPGVLGAITSVLSAAVLPIICSSLLWFATLPFEYNHVFRKENLPAWLDWAFGAYFVVLLGVSVAFNGLIEAMARTPRLCRVKQAVAIVGMALGLVGGMGVFLLALHAQP